MAVLDLRRSQASLGDQAAAFGESAKREIDGLLSLRASLGWEIGNLGVQLGYLVQDALKSEAEARGSRGTGAAENSKGAAEERFEALRGRDELHRSL